MTSSLQWERKSPDDKVVFELARVNYDMIETMNIEMEAGRAFSKNFGADSSTIIVNEAAVNVMGLKDPVGKVVKLGGEDRQIIGATKNFHFQSLHEEVKPLLFVLAPENTYDVIAKIKAGKERETTGRLERFYKAYNPGFTFDYKFLDEAYQAQYAAEKRVAALSKYFSGIAILISCLGLFRLAAFTAERRQKEIGMRKVLGASVAQIVLLLSRDFILLVLIAILIAFPVALWSTNKWLQDFAYKADIHWWLYALAATTAILIALVAVSSQAIKAAIVNPVKSLRTE